MTQPLWKIQSWLLLPGSCDWRVEPVLRLRFLFFALFCFDNPILDYFPNAAITAIEQGGF
jgi:hypothetical protein